MKKKLIFFVWISNKYSKNWEILEAFSSETNSWKIIDKLESFSEWCEVYKTNLVSIVPLDENNKIRYPNFIEKEYWLKILEEKIKQLFPDLIILFWKQVYDFVISKTSIEKSIFIYAYHPSYIAVYKRKEEEKYINDLVDKIKFKLS